MKLSLLILLLSCSFIAQADVIGGLKQEVSFRHMGYIHTPKSRTKFTTFGSYSRYKKKQVEIIRTRLNSKIVPLRDHLNFTFEQKGSLLMEYDPSLEFVVRGVDALGDIGSLTYPMTIRIHLPAEEGFSGLETVAFSFKQSPGSEVVRNLYNEILGIFRTTYEYEPPKKRYKNNKEKELLEPLKLKKYSYYQYEPYFAFYFGGKILVDKQYAADLGRVLNAKYIRFFRSFKTRYFLTSSDIKGLVNQGVITDIQTIIEESKYTGNLEKPFEVNRDLLPASILRLEKKVNELRLSLIIGGKAESFNPKSKKIINNYFDQSIKNH